MVIYKILGTSPPPAPHQQYRHWIIFSRTTTKRVENVFQLSAELLSLLVGVVAAFFCCHLNRPIVRFVYAIAGRNITYVAARGHRIYRLLLSPSAAHAYYNNKYQKKASWHNQTQDDNLTTHTHTHKPTWHNIVTLRSECLCAMGPGRCSAAACQPYYYYYYYTGHRTVHTRI